MDWILEKSLDLYQSFIKGELTREQVFTLLIPVVLIGVFLARKSVWELVKAQRRRVREYIQLQETRDAIEAKQKQVNDIVDRIEEKLQTLKTNELSFNLKTNKIFQEIEDPSFADETGSEKANRLKASIGSLSETYKETIKTVEDVEDLLKDIAEIRRSEVLRKNSRQMVENALRKARSRRQSRD